MFAEAKDYSYANARVRAMKSRLLNSRDLERASSLEDLVSFVGFLEEINYLQSSEVKGHNRPFVEKTLLRHLMRSFETIHSLCPLRSRDFMAERIKRPEVDAVKSVINEGSADEEVLNEIVSSEVEEAFGNIQPGLDVERLIQVFEDTDYMDILQEGFEKYQQTGLKFVFTKALEEYHFRNLFTKAEDLEGADKQKAKEILRKEAEILNISIAFRLQQTDSLEEMEEFFLPFSRHVGLKTLMDTAAANDPSEAVAFYSETRYSDVLDEALDNYQEKESFFEFEKALESHFCSYNRLIISKNQFNVGSILAYLNLKEREIKNLYRIAVSLAHGMDKEEIQSLLIY